MKSYETIKIKGMVRIITTDAKTGAVKRVTKWMRNIIVTGVNTGRNLIAQRLGGTNAYTLNLTKADIGRGHPAPGAPTVAVGAAGVITGAYTYKITFVTADGETEGGTTSATVNPSSQKIDLTAIPLGASGVTQRKVYRTVASGSQHKFVATIADNATTAYTDNLADGSLGANVPTATTAGATAPANTDTKLQTASLRANVTNQIIANNVLTVQFFFPDASLPNGTYSEFGTFVDGAAGVDTGQLFNRVLFGAPAWYIKNAGEDTTVEVQFTIS